MAHRIHITALALLEISEKLQWLSRRSRPAAARRHAQFLEAIRSLEINPEQWGLAPESSWHPGDIRQLLRGKRGGVYRILFEVRGNTVYILRVRHARPALLEPGEIELD